MNARYQRFLAQVARQDSPEGDLARKWLAEQAKSKATKAKRSAPRRQAQKATREQRAENLGRTREVVTARSAGLCEACRTNRGCHLHHLYGGSGRRKLYEGPNAMVMLCVRCHHQAHESDPLVLQWIVDRAELIGAPDVVLASLNRRVQRSRSLSESSPPADTKDP